MSAVPVMSPPVAEPIFRARGLSKTYHMGEVDVHALRDVSLDLRRGEFVVILGPSGSGKSTLLNILGGLDVPTSGSVTFLDHDLSIDDPRVHRRPACAQGRIASRDVRVGREGGGRTEVTGGLDAGALVVRHPSDRIEEGLRARPARAE